MTSAPFGRVLTAMVSPFDGTGALDLDATARLATYLVEQQANDGLVINGTGGEAPTTSDAEKADLVRAVKDAVGARAHVLAGVGSFDTAHSVHLAEQAAKAGADGLLVVTPYYSRPPQAGVVDYFRRVADATDLPVLIYDIPVRTGTAVTAESLIELAGHPNIVGVKDAKSDITGTSRVLAETDLAYYCGTDAETLAWLAIGAVGVVGTSTHFSGPQTAAMIDAHVRGDNAEALRLHRQLLPIYTGIFRTAGTILVKAGLRLLSEGGTDAEAGLDAGPVRSPLMDATPEQIEQLRQDLAAAGLR